MESEIRKKIRRAKSNIGNLVGRAIVEMIVHRTRNGKLGVRRFEGNRYPLKKLAESTVRSRRYKKLHISTTPETSNLTESGKMLDNLTYRYRVVSDGVRFEIYFRSRAMSIRADWVSKDRPFLNISRVELKRIEEIASKLMERELQNLKV